MLILTTGEIKGSTVVRLTQFEEFCQVDSGSQSASSVAIEVAKVTTS